MNMVQEPAFAIAERGFQMKSLILTAIVAGFAISDLFFIGLNSIWRLLIHFDIASPKPDFILIGNDYGIPEILNFAKCFTVAFLLAVLTPSHMRQIWVPVAAIFVLLFLDDSLRLHENLGAWIADIRLDHIAERKIAQSIGQVVYAVGLGIIVYGTIAVVAYRSDSASRQYVRLFFLLLVALGFFGVVIDFINAYFVEQSGIGMLESLGSLIENGGEMIIFTLCVLVAAKTVRHYQA